MAFIHLGRAAAQRLALLCIVAAAAGCASMDATPDPTPGKPKAGESAVVISVTLNGDAAASVTEMTVRRAPPASGGSGEALHTLRQLDPDLARDTALFVGALPPGEYEIVTLGTAQAGTELRLDDHRRQLIGRFAVAGGRPVDLGRLIMTPVNQYRVVGRSARVTSNRSLLQHLAGAPGPAFDGEVTPGWLQPRHADDLVEEYALSRPAGADNPIALADGRVAAGSRMGRVLIGDPEGDWQHARSAGLSSFLAVMQGPDPATDLLAVGEFSALARLPAGSRRLVSLDTGDLPPGNLLFIDGNDRTGWYLAHQAGRTLTVFRSAQLAQGRWQPVRTETLATSAWTALREGGFWRHPGGFSYAMADGAIHTLAHDSGRWSTSRLPHDHRVTAVAAGITGSVGILASTRDGAADLPAPLYLSADDGRSWQGVLTPWPRHVAPPWRLASGTWLVAGGTAGQPALQASTDEGRTWQRRSSFAPGRRLLPLASGAVLAFELAPSGLFSVSRSADEGASWQREFANHDLPEALEPEPVTD